MKVYKNCSSLSIYLLDRIFQTKDRRYLIIDFKEGSDINLSDKQQAIIDDKYTEIIHEYGELTVNRSIIKNYKLRMKILELRYLHDTTIGILQLYVKTNLTDVLNLLNDLDWRVDTTKTIEPQIEKILKKLKGIKNQVKIKEANFKNEFESDDKELKSTLEKDALLLEINLGLKRKIDTKETSVVEWTNLVNLSIEKNKHNG